MDYLYLYLYGVAANILLLLAHYTFGYLTIPNQLILNYRKIGIQISLTGGIGKNNLSPSEILLDCLLSWFAVLVNTATLLKRAINVVTALNAPKEFQEISYRVKMFDLSPEEVIMLEIKNKNIITGALIKIDEIDQIIESARNKNISIDKKALLELLTTNMLTK